MESIVLDGPSWSPVTTTLYLSGAQGLGFYVLFEIWRRRPRNKSCYETRLFSRPHRSQPFKGGFFGWVAAAIMVNDDETLRCVGLDTFMFLRFLRMSFKISAISSIFALLGLVPLYRSGGDDTDTTTGYNTYTMANIKDGSNKHLWVMLFFWYAFVGLVLYFIWEEWQAYLPLRRIFLLKGDIDTSKEYRYTLLVEGVPEAKRSSRTLFNYFSRLFPGQVVYANLYLNIEDLESTIKNKMDAIIHYENAVASVCNDPLKPVPQTRLGGFICCGGKLVDSLPYYRNEIEIFHEMADLEYQRILSFGKELARYEELNLALHYGALQDGMLRVGEAFGMPLTKKREIKVAEDSKDASFKQRWRKTVSSTGFVTFNSLAVKQAALQCKLSNMPYTFDTFPAPEPRDILWENVTKSLNSKRVKKAIADGCWIVGILFWAFPVGATQALKNIEEIREKFPWIYMPPSDSLLYGFVVGYVPVIAYLLLMYFLPIAIDISAQRFICFKSQSEVDAYVFKWHFGFQVANLWLILIGGSMFTELNNMFQTPSSTLQSISSAVPGASQFFLNILINNIFAGMSLELSMILSVFKTGITTRMKKDKHRSQRDIDARFEPRHLEWGTIYPPMIFNLLVGFVYACIVPIIQPFCALYFGLSYLVYKHQTLHVYGQRAEGGAAYFPPLYNFIIACLFIAELIIVFYLGIKKGELQASMAFFPIIATFLFDRYIRLNFSGNSQTLALESAREADIMSGGDIKEDTAFLSALNSEKDIDMNSFRGRSTFIGMNDDLEYTQPALRRSKWELEPMPYRNEVENRKRESIEMGVLHQALAELEHSVSETTLYV